MVRTEGAGRGLGYRFRKQVIELVKQSRRKRVVAMIKPKVAKEYVENTDNTQYSVTEAAKIAGITRGSMKHKVIAGIVKSVKTANGTRVTLKEIRKITPGIKVEKLPTLFDNVNWNDECHSALPERSREEMVSVPKAKWESIIKLIGEVSV